MSKHETFAPGGIGKRLGRLTARGRLTLTFVTLLLAGCGTMLAIVYSFMRYVPTYRFGDLKAAGTPQAVTGSSLTAVGQLRPSAVTTAADVPQLSIASQAGVLRTLLWVSLAALIAILLIGAWASWIVAGRVLRPLRRINDAAHLAGSGSLTHRIGLTGPDDEITELSRTFDLMLERLDASFQARQRFAANASHELQTPLSATKTILDVAAADLSSVDLHRLVTQLRETNSRSIETIEALLDLADADRRDIDRQDIDVAALVVHAVGDAGPEIDRRSLTVLSDLHDGRLLGDPVLLRRLTANLVGNAVRHNVQDGFIAVCVRTDAAAAQVRMTISNSGPLVTDHALALLTEPFFRAAGRVVDAAAAHRGHGLGLALVKDIVHAHDGELHVKAHETGGLTVDVLLPFQEVRRDDLSSASTSPISMSPMASRLDFAEGRT